MDNGSCMETSSLCLSDLPSLTDLIIGSDENCNNSYSFYCCKKLELVNLPALQTLEFGLFAFHLASALHLKSDLRFGSFPVDLPNLISVSFNNTSFSKLQSLEWSGMTHVANISIGNRCMNLVSEMEFSDFPCLEHLSFGSDCCRNVKDLKMRGLGQLRVISIGDHSFYKTLHTDFVELPVVSTFTVGKKVFPSLVRVNMECGVAAAVSRVVVSDTFRSVMTNICNSNSCFCLFHRYAGSILACQRKWSPTFHRSLPRAFRHCCLP